MNLTNLEQLNSYDGENELKYVIHNENVEHILHRRNHTVEHGLECSLRYL